MYLHIFSLKTSVFFVEILYIDTVLQSTEQHIIVMFFSVHCSATLIASNASGDVTQISLSRLARWKKIKQCLVSGKVEVKKNEISSG